MNGLTISVLGSFSAYVHRQPLVKFRTNRVLALLVYLLTEQVLGTEVHRREGFLDLFWPGLLERSAYQNLRQTIYQLRKMVPDLVGGPVNDPVPFLLANRQTIALNPDYPIDFDFARFQQLLHGQPQQWDEAVNLYRGDFLSDFYIPDASPFEEWAQARRVSFRQQALDALVSLAIHFNNRGFYEKAIPFARRQIEIESLREDGYRQLMIALASSGRQTEAVSLFNSLHSRLERELGITPDGETLALHQSITSGKLEHGQRPAAKLRGFELREQIGAGSYGAVYRAIQPAVNREVAVKIILPKFANDPDFIRHFEAEAQTIAQLEHPHIVPLYDYWREPDNAYLVMRYLRGGSLRQALQNGPWEIGRAVNLVEQIADALHTAHERGIIHRDIKPGNILLDTVGHSYLSDFGIAQDLPAGRPAAQKEKILPSISSISPEQIRREPLTPATDIYSFGVLLYNLLSGASPFAADSLTELLHQHAHDPLPALHSARPDLPPAVDDVIQRATAKAPGNRFQSAPELAAAFRGALQQNGGYLLPVPLKKTIELDNPYKGLRAFTASDAEIFFGREQLVERLLAHFREDSRFLAVIGPSGSGKSSLVRAGLLPALRRNAVPGSADWYIVDMIPGGHPFEELELALQRVAIKTSSSLRDEMKRGERGLLQVLRRDLPDDRTPLLLIIDQFEELFTLVEDPDHTRRFLHTLQTALADPYSPLRVVITLRADFYDRVLLLPGFSELIRLNTEVITPMNSEELARAIRRPAELAGVSFEPLLVTQMMTEVNEQPGSLPLLQYTLSELFEQRVGNRLTREGYEQFGGITGAIGRRAEDIFKTLDEGEREMAHQLFLRLVTLGEGVEDTRRRVLLAELTDLDTRETTGQKEAVTMASAIQLFGAARLLSFDHDSLSREPTVEVAHEALLREWPRLRNWLSDSRDDVRRQRELGAAVRQWQEGGRDDSYLIHGARLAASEAWAETTSVGLTAAENAFLQASLTARNVRHEAEEARRRRELETARELAAQQTKQAKEQSQAARRLRRLAAGLAFVLLLALGLGWLANNQRAAAQANFMQAQRIRLASQAQNALDRGEGGELPALLALRSLTLDYSPEADTALITALRRGFSRQHYLGHSGSVTGGLFTPDGRLIVTSSLDGTLRLWQAQTGKELRLYAGHTGPIWRHALSPDGRTILSSGFDGTARVWNLETGVELHRFTHEDGVTAVDFSPDGAHILTGSGPVLFMWNLATGLEVRRFEGHTDTVFAGVFSPDGRYLASAGQDNTLRLWETESGAEMRQFLGHTDWIGVVNFSPDGRYLVTSSADRTARIWDVETGLEVRRLVGHTDEVFSAEFSPDGQMIATGSRDKTARLWHTVTGREIRQIRGHTGGVFSNFSPDGSLLVTSSEDRTARLWDVVMATEPQTVIRPAGGHTANHTAAAISPDGQLVLTDQGDGTIRLWQTQTSELIEEVPLQADSATSLAFSPDGSLALAGGSNGTAYLIPASPGQQTARLVGHAGSVGGGVFSPDGRLALTGGNDGTVRLWEVRTGREAGQFLGHTGPVRSVAFSPDGRQILSGGDDQTMILWAAGSGEQLQRFGGQNGVVLAVAFAPDGQSVAAGHDNHSAVLWDAATGEISQQLIGHTDRVNHVAFSPDGQYLLTGSADQTARLWDVHTGQLLHQFVGHESPLLTVGFSADGQTVYTADAGNVYAWRTTLAAVIGYACAQLSRDFTSEERAFYNITTVDPTCPEAVDQAAQVAATWTPRAPGAIAAAPLLLGAEREIFGDPANAARPEQRLTIKVDDISETGEITPIAGTRAQLVTDDQGATLQVYTTGLTPGHAVTLWLVFFNNPENCSDGECGPDDAFPPPGNTAAGAAVMYGAGQVIRDNGRAYFAAYAAAGENAAPWPVGLLNPRTAEIHFILRDHGPAIEGLVYEQITTADAGCNNFGSRAGDYTCVDVQAGFFKQQQP